MPQAFSHFSYEFSSGARMVCDLQGCFDRERGFELTDPCMLSKVGRSESGYGRTDRGLHGLVDFFRTHKCTPLCKALGLTDARVREQELVVEEALRKKEEREAGRAAAERAAEAEREKRRQAKEAKRERRAAEKLQEKKVEDDLAAATAEARGLRARAARAVSGAVSGAAKGVAAAAGGAANLMAPAVQRAQMLLNGSAEELEDAAAEAGYPRSAAGVVRYKQSLRDKVKAEERRLERKAEEAEKERRRKERQKARKAADAAAAAATDEHKDEEKEEKKRVRPQPPAAAFENSDEDSDDSDDYEGFFARMTGRGAKAAPAKANATAEQAAIARGRMAIGTEHPMFPDNCGRCGAPNASKICGRCRAMHYCSATCQRADWAQHKEDCFNAELLVRPRAKG